MRSSAARAAMGCGVFSDNGVLLECRGDPARLPELLDYASDRQRVTRFLHLLMQRRTPYRLTRERIGRYPVLVELLETARAIAASGRPLNAV